MAADHGALPCARLWAEVGTAEAEAMMILIAGTFICNYNRALTGDINHDILGSLARLAR